MIPYYNLWNQDISLVEMGIVDNEMVSYLNLVTSLFTVSPTLIKDAQRQRQLETKFNQIMADQAVKDVDEIIQRALFKYKLLSL